MQLGPASARSRVKTRSYGMLIGALHGYGVRSILPLIGNQRSKWSVDLRRLLLYVRFPGKGVKLMLTREIHHGNVSLFARQGGARNLGREKKRGDSFVHTAKLT